ncbi:MAG: TonB-dependent receptor [Bacteroidia bacterium]
MKRHLIYIFLFFFSSICYSQSITGVITDAISGEDLPGATIKIKGTTIATSSGGDGKFNLNVSNFPVTLLITYIGYESKELKLSELPNAPLKIQLSEKQVDMTEIEVKTSRITEKEKESPITVESMGSKQIKEAAASTFYEGLGNMKGVDITAASLGFRVVNTRGFNSTSPVRCLQLIDGVDNQSPGLNFSLGNFLGASDLDVKKVDIVSGASSAFYGPNAFNGVISMESKSPFETPGLNVQTKIGERQLREIGFRLAQVIKDKKGKEILAYKVVLFSMGAYDWEATNYNPTNDSKKGMSNPGRYDAINKYGDEVIVPGNDYTDPISKTEYLGLGMYYRSGYKESDLVNYNTNNTKFNSAIHYKITPKTELIYSFNMGSGSTVYQGDNRYSLRNIRFWQNRLEWREKEKFFVRFYSTKEDAGDSYDLVYTAMRLNDAAASTDQWYKTYRNNWKIFRFNRNIEGLAGYNGNDSNWVRDSLDYFLNFYNDTITKLHARNMEYIDRESYNRYEPGTQRFDSMVQDITSRNFTDKGTRFYDKSALYHFQAEYKFTHSWGDIVTGTSARLYRPLTRGTIFRDTGNVQISNYEYGLYAGYDQKFGGNHWKVNVTARLDKNQNFNFLVSPAASLIYMPRKEHNFRFTVSRAIRNPTLADQYLYYNVGRAILIGNLDGFDSLITLESFDVYRQNLSRSSLVYRKVKPIEPEKVLTFEAGYKAELNKSLFLDAGYYYSIYQSFIGYNIGIVATFNGNYPRTVQPYRLSANSNDVVTTTGLNIGLSYFFKKYSLSGNYSYNMIDLRDTDDPIVPAFNTPRNKFNLSFSGRDCKLPFTKYKRLGFGINYKWIEGFEFTGSPQFSGFITSYDMLDAQINYFFPKQYLTLKIGGSNLMGIAPLFDTEETNKVEAMFNNRNTQVYGGPSVGRLAYISLLFEINGK